MRTLNTFLAAIAVASIGVGYLPQRAYAEDASVEGVAKRAVDGFENHTVGVVRGFQKSGDDIFNGKTLGERVILPVPDGAATLVVEGSSAVVNYSAGLVDVPGALLNAGSRAFGGKDILPSSGEILGGAANTVHSVAKDIYGFATNWMRGPRE